MEGTYPSRMNDPIEAGQLVPPWLQAMRLAAVQRPRTQFVKIRWALPQPLLRERDALGLQQAPKPERPSGRCVRPTTTPTSDHRFFTRPTGRSKVASSQAIHSTKGSLRRVRQSARDWTCPT